MRASFLGHLTVALSAVIVGVVVRAVMRERDRPKVVGDAFFAGIGAVRLPTEEAERLIAHLPVDPTK